MIDLVLDRTDPAAFERLAEQLAPMIRRAVVSFTRDRMLARTEDADSLANLCLLKVHQARGDFIYEPKLSEEHNQRRFLALVKRYITNILIDHQYSANLSIRKPSGGLVSTAEIVEDEESQFEPCDMREPDPIHCAIANELIQKIRERLDEEDALVFDLLLQGYSAEGVSRKIGIATSRVRYLIYSRIQPQVSEFCVC